MVIGIVTLGGQIVYAEEIKKETEYNLVKSENRPCEFINACLSCKGDICCIPEYQASCDTRMFRIGYNNLEELGFEDLKELK